MIFYGMMWKVRKVMVYRSDGFSVECHGMMMRGQSRASRPEGSHRIGFCQPDSRARVEKCGKAKLWKEVAGFCPGKVEKLSRQGKVM